MPFKRAVASAKSDLPFIALANMDQVVRVMEVNFCIESHLVQAVEFYCNIFVFLFDIKRLNISCILETPQGICTYV